MALAPPPEETGEKEIPALQKNVFPHFLRDRELFDGYQLSLPWCITDPVFVFPETNLFCKGVRTVIIQRLRPLLASTLLLLLTLPAPSFAVSRGEVVAAVVQALDLPPWSGKEHFADVHPNHPQAPYIETASALGVLLPGDHFHPDMEATRVEALGFAFLAMGWRKEGDLVRALDPSLDPSLPPFLACYLRIAENMTPQPPRELLSEGRNDCSPQDLQRIVAWLKSCRTNPPRWNARYPGTCGDLVVHREGLGTPPAGWSIAVQGLLSEKEAKVLAAQFKKQGLLATVGDDGFAFAVRSGPYNHYMKAWKDLTRVPMKYNPSIVPSGGGSESLFWVAIAGRPEALQGRILTAANLGKTRLPLSRIAAASRVEGAVNAGFFGGKTIIGTLISEGRPLAGAYKDRSAIGWNARGEVYFGNGAYRRHIDPAPGAPSPRGTSARPEGGSPVPPPDPLWILPQAQAAPMPSPVQEEAEATPPNLLFTPPATWELIWRDEPMGRMDHVVQAGPMLLKDGVAVNPDEGFSKSTVWMKHPRTFVGYDGELLWWVVVDGRNPWHSMGLTLEETRRLAANLGLSSALNMDGGGSSTLWWHGVVVNAPSGGQERMLPYGVGFGRQP